MAGKKGPKDVHVVYDGGVWKVKVEGNQRASSTHDTQQAAADVGRDRARQEGSDLLIHRKDNGQIRSKDSYGNDPNPPKDREH